MRKSEVILRDLNSSNGSIVNEQKIKDGNFIVLNQNDKIKFGKDTNVYTLEININHALMTEQDNTIQYPSIIKDEKISLVSDEFYSKATRNHLEKKDRININSINANKPNYINLTPPEEIKYPISRQSSLISPYTGTESPKFNTSIKEDNDLNVNNQNLNVTFKNSKNANLDQEKRNKLYEELYVKIEKLTKENEVLTKKNYEIEEKLLQISNGNKKKDNSIDQVTEEYSKLTARHNALLIYSSDIQKRIDIIEIELNDKKKN